MDEFVNDFDFTLPGDEGNKRGAYRASISGLMVRAGGREYPVRDISSVGCAFLDVSKNRFRQGEAYELEFVFHEKPLMTKLAVDVKRVLDNGLVGCSFVGLSPRQEAMLDKLVLEVQKRAIALKKAKEKE